MNLGLRDRTATVLVVSAVGLAVAWLASVPVTESLDGRTVALVVTVCGMLASASAVVPGFSALLRGSRSYLVGTSTLGTLALVAAGASIVLEDERALLALTAATVILWALSTARHAGSFGASPAALRP